MSESLTVCVVPEDYRAEASDLFTSWTQAGLIGGVVLCSQSDPEADCHFSDDLEWKSGRLWKVLGRATYEAVTVAVLRPDGPSDNEEKVDWEHRLAEDLSKPFEGSKVRLRRITVGVANPEMPTGDRAFSPQWDAHLLHDLSMVGHVEAVRSPVGAEDRAGVCMVTALLAGGGWAFTNQVWKVSDRPVGNTKPFRIVRPQIRILYGGDPRIRVAAGTIPITPPWPRPKGTETIRVGPDIEVPRDLGISLASRCEFRLRQARTGVEPEVSFTDKMRTAVRILGKPLTSPRPPDPVERALDRLNAMDAGLSGHPRQAESPTEDRAMLLKRIRRSGMPDLALGRVGDPEPWRRMRRVLYGLVDASVPGEDVRMPYHPQGADPSLLPVWSDPHMIAPPPDAEAFDLDGDLPDELGTDRIEAIDVANCRTAHHRITGGDSNSPASDTEERQDDGEMADRWLSWRERWRWTPLWTLADRLAGSLEGAHRAFAQYSQRARSDSEHRAAVHARRKLRRTGWTLTIAALLAGLAVAERHTGLAGDWLQFVIGPPAGSYFDIIAYAALGAFGVGVMGSLARRVVVATLAFEKAERSRESHSNAARHYASELARLHTAAAEFHDHQKVIRTMLHKPFGPLTESPDVGPQRRLIPEHCVPASIVIATSAADPAKLADVRKEIAQGVINRGWLLDAHSKALALWRPSFERQVTTDFDPPDADNSPPDAEFLHDPAGGGAVPFPRQHFTDTVAADSALRRALRIEFPLSVTEEGFDALRILGLVQVEHGPQMPDTSAEEFLRIDEPGDQDWFSQEILDKAAGLKRRHTRLEGPEKLIELPDGEERDEMIMANWLIPMSDPIEPRHLAGWRSVTDAAIVIQGSSQYA